MKPNFFLYAVICCFALASAVVAAGDIVALRQSDMKAIAAATKSIAGMFKVPATYSPGEFKWAADTIRDKSGEGLIAHFAAEAADPKSKANQISSKSASGLIVWRTI
ncbi:cytochrome c' [Rhizobium azibense]|nr:cytochrome c' [Rhizobium azibense]